MYKPLITELEWQKQENLCELRPVYSQFKDSQDYIILRDPNSKEKTKRFRLGTVSASS